MIDLAPYHAALTPTVLDLWQASYSDRHPIIPELWEAATALDPSFEPGDTLIALRSGQPVGFVLAKRWRGQFPGCEQLSEAAHVALLAVHPDHRRQGIGRKLLQAAETRMRGQGAKRMGVGGSLHHVMPGIPAGDETAVGFFAALGYQLGKEVWDVRADLRTVDLPDPGPASRRRPDLTVRPFRPGEEGSLASFLGLTFPGRWHRDTMWRIEAGGDIGEVMGVFDGDRPLGFAQLSPPGVSGAWRWAGFNPSVAALGPIGVADELKGQGFGLALLVRGLDRLRELGATDTVIDWTDLLDFYAKAGFRPWLKYRLAAKALA
jgi:GNAT superfamily N-acetyltransferase